MVSSLSSNASPIPILTYHQIADARPRGTPFRSLSVATSDFERHMAFLSLLGYRGLSMTALLPYLRAQRSGKVVGITFDDGYLNNLDNALPVLRRYGFSSTCYAVSQRLGKTNVWDAGLGIPQTPLMTGAQLRAWVAGGQEVGAHTRNHVHLPELDGDSCRQEIAGCKSELEDTLGSVVHHFCYPYGDYSPEHVDMVGDAGYLTATTTQRSRCHAQEDLLRLPRVPVPRTLTRLALWLKVATAYEDRRRK